MSVRLRVVLLCDARRSPRCEVTRATEALSVREGVARVRQDAADADWTREPHAGELLDACAACSALWEAGHTAVGVVVPLPRTTPPDPDPSIPRNIGEAVERDRQRAAEAQP